MNVIEFPQRGKTPARDLPLNDTIEAAVQVHDLILAGLRSDILREHPDTLATLLPVAFAKRFGPDGADLAELQFQRVYRVDPYTFIDRAMEHCKGA